LLISEPSGNTDPVGSTHRNEKKGGEKKKGGKGFEELVWGGAQPKYQFMKVPREPNKSGCAKRGGPRFKVNRPRGNSAISQTQEYYDSNKSGGHWTRKKRSRNNGSCPGGTNQKRGGSQ